MLHNRLASNLRDHFSTVGPSPVTSLLPSAASSPEFAHSHQTGSNRLILLPPPASPIRNPDDAGSRSAMPSLPSDILASTAHRAAAFFAEAAVLVLVLGILDRFLASNRIELRWITGAFLIAAALLAASVATDVTARRWLRAH